MVKPNSPPPSNTPPPGPLPSEGRGSLREKLIAQIRQTGPITVADYMRACLYDPEHGYYSTRPKLGGDKADFITAPEASQMFGELVGLWCAHEWSNINAPFDLIELGPGRGVLMQDAVRATSRLSDFTSAANITFIETSAPLRDEQKERVPHANWADGLEQIPPRPSLIIANEFLDCLPIRQFVRDGEHWREKLVGVGENNELVFGLSPPSPPGEGAGGGVKRPTSSNTPPPVPLPSRGGGAAFELSPALPAFIDTLSQRLHAFPGRALFIDYGYAEPEGADTLQALRNHQKEHPLAHPGEADLTAHVDFGNLARLATEAGLSVNGPMTQRDFLRALGVEQRAAALAKANPERAERIARELHRLTHQDEMGVLFKVLCLSSPHLPPPAGF